MTTILSIVPYKIFPAKVGGQKGIAVFNEYLARQCALVCLTVKANEPRYANGYSLLNNLSDSSLRYINPWYIFKVKKYIRKYQVTHLLLEHPYYGWLGMLVKWLTGVKLIIHSHNIEATRWKSLGKWWWKILWQYEKVTHRQADYNFFIHDEDRTFAISRFHLAPSKCITVTYGIDWNTIPSKSEITTAKKTLRERYELKDETLLLFNGAFDYSPNLDALIQVINVIDPLLEARNFQYKIVICGRSIPEEISSRKYSNIIFAGFVDDVSTYFKGADIFINPIVEGGGIKTKLVEALGYNLNAVSTNTGAIGVDAALTNGKLKIVDDEDWNAFAEAIVNTTAITADVPAKYFQHFYWGYSIEKAVRFIENG